MGRPSPIVLRRTPYNELVRVEVLGTDLHLTIVVDLPRLVHRNRILVSSQHPAGPGFGSKRLCIAFIERYLLYYFTNLS